MNTRAITLALCAVGLLSGCAMATSMVAEKTGVKVDFWNPDPKLIQSSYAAADYISQQARTYIDERDLVKAQPLTSFETPTLTSEFGKQVTAQVGTRLAQLGYRMDLSAVVPQIDEGFHEAPDRLKTPHHILAGTYLANGRKVEVSLRIIDNRSGRVIGAFDYEIDKTGEVDDMLDPKPRAFIVGP